MKKCPFCKADIEDNARFCLYCMKPLNEKEVIPLPKRKKQWWPFALAAVLLIALVAVIMLMPRGNGNLPAESTGEETSSTGQTTDSQAGETTDESTQDTQSDSESQGDTTLEENQNTTGTPSTNQKPNKNQNSNTPTPTESTTPATKPTKPTTPTAPTTPTTTPTTPTTTPQETAQPEETTLPENTTAPETQKTEVVYTYRAARAGDDFNAQYQNTGNDIVITGISHPSTDGVYDIPAYIEGRKVIAIVANAFSGSNVKIVYVPATAKTIWNHAFAGCGLTDIYFRGNAIYVESNAFGSALTIHCSASCSDRNFRYYKNTAASYGATWAEWYG